MGGFHDRKDFTVTWETVQLALRVALEAYNKKRSEFLQIPSIWFFLEIKNDFIWSFSAFEKPDRRTSYLKNFLTSFSIFNSSIFLKLKGNKKINSERNFMYVSGVRKPSVSGWVWGEISRYCTWGRAPEQPRHQIKSYDSRLVSQSSFILSSSDSQFRGATKTNLDVLSKFKAGRPGQRRVPSQVWRHSWKKSKYPYIYDFSLLSAWRGAF